MATYHLTLMPAPWEEADPRNCPLSPRDVTADDGDDALQQAKALIAEDWHPLSQDAFDRSGSTDVANQAIAFLKQWFPVAHRVERPIVDVRPRSTARDVVENGRVVGTLFDYGWETGTRSFDVLIGGSVRGLLVQHVDEVPVHAGGTCMWCLAKATGPLASLLDRQWIDDCKPRTGVSLDWPGMALAGIRAALEHG